jgi:hypothetical protein
MSLERKHMSTYTKRMSLFKIQMSLVVKHIFSVTNKKLLENINENRNAIEFIMEVYL